MIPASISIVKKVKKDFIAFWVENMLSSNMISLTSMGREGLVAKKEVSSSKIAYNKGKKQIDM